MQAPELVDTARLRLRRPRADDAVSIFSRYASDAEVTRYLAWPRHVTIEDSHSFIQFSDAVWQRDGVGPYLVELRDASALLGGTGLGLHSAHSAETGYVLAKDAWGKGYATEALYSMVDVGKYVGLHEVTARVHADNVASVRVLEKVGFSRSLVTASLAFPNLDVTGAIDVMTYARLLSR